MIDRPPASAPPVAHRMSERDLQEAVVKLARMTGWLVYHTHDSRRSAAGFPDLVLAHPGTGALLFAELKSATGRVTAEQWTWLRALGHRGRAFLWRPGDLLDGGIARELRRYGITRDER